LEENKKDFDLKAELKSLGMTQKDFAEKIEKSVHTVTRWVKGEVETPKIVKLYLEAYKKAKLFDDFAIQIK
jgi:transcriptional regulator with XRE-family HTH domain